jgi:hypothetical protein
MDWELIGSVVVFGLACWVCGYAVANHQALKRRW